MRLASEEPAYNVGDTLPNGEGVIELRPIKFGSEIRGWLYCTADDADHRYTETELEEMKCPTKPTTH